MYLSLLGNRKSKLLNDKEYSIIAWKLSNVWSNEGVGVNLDFKLIDAIN